MGENGSGMGWIESVVSSALSLFSHGFGERGRIARLARSDYYGTIIPNLMEQLGKGRKHPFTFADRQYEPFVTRRVDLTKGEQLSVEGIRRRSRRAGSSSRAAVIGRWLIDGGTTTRRNGLSALQRGH
jgi:hypothetical protein